MLKMDIEVCLKPFKFSVVMLRSLGKYPWFIPFQWLNGLSAWLLEQHQSKATYSDKNLEILCVFHSKFWNIWTSKLQFMCSCSMSSILSSEIWVPFGVSEQYFFPEEMSLQENGL